MPHQHDNHLVPYIKSKFNLTVQWDDYDGWIAFKGDYDLDIPSVLGDTVFGTALEYGSCYDGELGDRLNELEMGIKFERIQLPNDYMEKSK